MTRPLDIHAAHVFMCTGDADLAEVGAQVIGGPAGSLGRDLHLHLDPDDQAFLVQAIVSRQAAAQCRTAAQYLRELAEVYEGAGSLTIPSLVLDADDDDDETWDFVRPV